MDQPWQHYPSTGCTDLDGDHHAISLLLEKVLEAINAPGNAGLGERLTAVVTAVTEHFAHEEELMQASGYPRRVEHTAAHALFVRDVLAFKAEFEAQGLTPAFRRWANGRLLEWFRRHIAVYDVELGLFLIAHGQEKAPALPPALTTALPT